MEFYIELTNDDISFRLQTDGNWRRINTTNLQASDFLTSDVNVIKNLQVINRRITIENQNWHILPQSVDFSSEPDQALHYEIYVIRQIKPKIPSKEQLKSVIAKGNDTVSNSLILNIYGLFELRDVETFKFPLEDPSIVYRFETFLAENDYVGVAAANDSNLIDSLYIDSLDHWLSHLQSGITGMYSDTFTYKDLNALIKEIDEFQI